MQLRPPPPPALPAFHPAGSRTSLSAPANLYIPTSGLPFRKQPGLLIFSVNMYYSLGILSNRVHRVITERIVHYLHISYVKGYLCNYRM